MADRHPGFPHPLKGRLLRQHNVPLIPSALSSPPTRPHIRTKRNPKLHRSLRAFKSESGGIRPIALDISLSAGY